jgi:hypothetical protein
VTRSGLHTNNVEGIHSQLKRLGRRRYHGKRDPILHRFLPTRTLLTDVLLTIRGVIWIDLGEIYQNAPLNVSGG